MTDNLTDAPVKLTVGIVNHNLAEYLPRAIESALLNTPNVIVADDGSTDDSLEVIARYPVKLIRNQEASGSAVWGWNQLIQACDTEYLVLLSADDELMPWTYELLGGDWCWGDLEVIDTDSNPIECWNYAFGFPRTVDECITYIASRLSLYPTLIAGFRTEWLKGKQAIEFPNVRGFSDTATGLSWLLSDPKLHYTPRTFARYRRRPGSETYTADREAMKRDLSEMLRGLQCES